MEHQHKAYIHSILSVYHKYWKRLLICYYWYLMVATDRRRPFASINSKSENIFLKFGHIGYNRTTDLARKKLFAKGYTIRSSRNIYSLFRNTNSWFSKHAKE